MSFRTARSLPVVSERGHEAIVWAYDARALTAPDEFDIDALARLQLAARRRGARLELYGAPARLIELLELAGLSEVLPCRRSGVETNRQIEEREELGIDEEVHPDDGVA